MIEAHKLAGFIAAHGMWCVADEDLLIPIYAYASESGERIVKRLVSEQLEDEEAVSHGRCYLEENEVDANDAVLIFDGRISLENKKYEALFIEIRSYFSPESKVTMVIPYLPAKPGQALRIHKPKYLQWEHCDDFNREHCISAFVEGVDSHEKGAEVWNRCID